MTDFQKTLIAVFIAFVLALMGIAVLVIGIAFSKDIAVFLGNVLTFFSLFILGRMLIRT